jgi:putative FmdB family regulatory protein
MPLYEYECDVCGRRFEVIQHKFSDPPPEVCRHCGKGPVHKLMSSPAIQFKGSGFYITDYAQKGKSDASSTTPSGKTDAATSDSGSTTPGAAGSTTSDGGGTRSQGGSTTSDSAKSDTAASSPKPSTGGTSKESKE